MEWEEKCDKTKAIIFRGGHKHKKKKKKKAIEGPKIALSH